MSSRPAIPLEIQRELLFECRYLCACDCVPVSLEKAHIVPWCKTKDHSFANLVVLCANCHTRSHAEEWPESHLRRFKQQPCALERDRLPPVTPEQRAMIDYIAAVDPNKMTDVQRLRLAAMFAAYAGFQYSEIRVDAVVVTHSSLIRLEMPRSAAERIIAGFQSQDPRLVSFLDEFAYESEAVANAELMRTADEDSDAAIAISENASSSFGPRGGIKLIETSRPTPLDTPPVTNIKEVGLESLIVNSMTSFGWISGSNSLYDREYAVDLF